MSHDTGQVCACSAGHQPYPLELNKHHVWPLEYGGPSVAENFVWLCPNAHYNVHELLRHMVAAGRPLLWGEVLALYDVPVSRYAYRVALLGYRRIEAKAVVGSL